MRIESKKKYKKTLPFLPVVSSLLSFHLPGVHGDLCRGDAFETGGYGSILLLPGGLELLRWFHRDAEFSGAGSG